MVNKAEALIHPVRIKISQALIRSGENGLTPLEMVKMIKDVPQATVYRHIQVMLDAGIIRIVKEKKVRSVVEKYYVLNAEEAKLKGEDWKNATMEEKLNYFSYYQITLLNQYESYLAKLKDQERTEDLSTFSLAEMKLDEKSFHHFQQELNELIVKYHNSSQTNNDSEPFRTVAITIIPET
ncbi:helix-turn-helix domain-containing protein [Niallia taxi]|uniref:Transcriptional regulator n=1 Tax=Niallia taxi TaxID=2499688 RepID=A0A437K6G3_9BACI|nr:helix-turn-helix domain-containing protein [Niallia taxi]RVT58850.1 transcriptional regulator [Niallia taxi]